jgi:ketol-acid reductoisomerase
MMLMPDESIGDVRERGGAEHQEGRYAGFAHGFNIHYGYCRAQILTSS